MIEPGQQLAGYTLFERIGRGSIGEVYRAENVRSAERVAIKVLEPELSQKSTVVERFFGEARTTSQLRHAGIAATIDCFVDDDRAFVVMELLEGETLAGYLSRAGRLDDDLPFVLGAGVAIASAVGAGHDARVLHRDLKPGNIHLHLAAPFEADVTVKVMDFGIARLSQEEDGPSQTASNLLFGSPPYMSPEQCRGHATDRRSDIYALGCVLYEALCGQPPFGQDAMTELIVAHLSRPPEPLSKRIPGVPSALNALVLRMLAKKPEDRPQTMGDVVRALRECARGMQIDLAGKALVPKRPVERPSWAVPRMAKADVMPIESRAVLPQVGVAQMPRAVMVAPVTPARTVDLAPPPGPAPAPETNVQDQRRAPEAAQTIMMSSSHPLASQLAEMFARADRKAPIEGSAGGTLVLKASEIPEALLAAIEPMEDGYSSRNPGDEDPIRGNPGGTMSLKDGQALPRALELAASGRAGSGQGKPTPLEKSAPGARVRGPWPGRHPGVALAAGAAAVLLIGAVAMVLRSPATHRRTLQGEQGSTSPSSSVQWAPDTVVITIDGLEPDVEVAVDGQAATLPIKLQKGPEIHRILLGSGRAVRSIEVDGTIDRRIEIITDR